MLRCVAQVGCDRCAANGRGREARGDKQWLNSAPCTSTTHKRLCFRNDRLTFHTRARHTSRNRIAIDTVARGGWIGGFDQRMLFITTPSAGATFWGVSERSSRARRQREKKRRWPTPLRRGARVPTRRPKGGGVELLCRRRHKTPRRQNDECERLPLHTVAQPPVGAPKPQSRTGPASYTHTRKKTGSGKRTQERPREAREEERAQRGARAPRRIPLTAGEQRGSFNPALH